MLWNLSQEWEKRGEVSQNNTNTTIKIEWKDEDWTWFGNIN